MMSRRNVVIKNFRLAILTALLFYIALLIVLGVVLNSWLYAFVCSTSILVVFIWMKGGRGRKASREWESLLLFYSVNKSTLEQFSEWKEGVIRLKGYIYPSKVCVVDEGVAICNTWGVLSSFVLIPWKDISRVVVKTVVYDSIRDLSAGILLYESPEDMELTIPWQENYKNNVPRSVGLILNEVEKVELKRNL